MEKQIKWKEREKIVLFQWSRGDGSECNSAGVSVTMLLYWSSVFVLSNDRLAQCPTPFAFEEEMLVYAFQEIIIFKKILTNLSLFIDKYCIQHIKKR